MGELFWLNDIFFYFGIILVLGLGTFFSKEYLFITLPLERSFPIYLHKKEGFSTHHSQLSKGSGKYTNLHAVKAFKPPTIEQNETEKTTIFYPAASSGINISSLNNTHCKHVQVVMQSKSPALYIFMGEQSAPWALNLIRHATGRFSHWFIVGYSVLILLLIACNYEFLDSIKIIIHIFFSFLCA